MSKDWADIIMQELEQYSDTVIDDVKVVVNKVATAGVKELQSTSPKNTGDYAKGWRKTIRYEDSTKIKVSVNNKNKPSITHLLENGYAKRNGGRVSAQKHIAQVEEKVREEFEKELKNIL